MQQSAHTSPSSPSSSNNTTTTYNTYRTFREISSIVRYDCCRTHGIFKAIYTTETSTGSDSIVGHYLVSPHADRYLVPGLSFKGGIFKEQQTTFV